MSFFQLEKDRSQYCTGPAEKCVVCGTHTPVLGGSRVKTGPGDGNFPSGRLPVPSGLGIDGIACRPVPSGKHPDGTRSRREPVVGTRYCSHKASLFKNILNLCQNCLVLGSNLSSPTTRDLDFSVLSLFLVIVSIRMIFVDKHELFKHFHTIIASRTENR